VLAATAAFALPLLLLMPLWPFPTETHSFVGKCIAAGSLALLAAIGALIYLVALRLLGGLDEQERNRILSLKLPFKKTLARIL
jgi:hypothetical protein